MSNLDDKPFPRGPLIGAGLLVAVSLASVTAARVGLLPGPERAAAVAVAAAPTATRDLRFADREDGAVLVQTVGGGAPMVIDPGSGGFVRGVVRGLARERRARGVGQDPAFRLTEWSDGRLTLEDPATGRRLSLDGFGPTNRQAFIDLLRGGPADDEERT
jgi:putative photosynthetic complex assembly protein